MTPPHTAPLREACLTGSMPSCPDAVQLWVAAPHIAPVLARVDSYAAELLDAEERRRAGLYRNEADRCAFVVSRALLRHALSRLGTRRPWEWRYAPDALGRLTLQQDEDHGSPPAFSLSRSRGLIVVAATNAGRVGVDVEAIDRDVDRRRIAARFFTAQEAAWLDTHADEEAHRRAFMRMWTLKEATLKALGVGLLAPPAACGFAFPHPSRIDVSFAPPLSGCLSGTTVRVALLQLSDAHQMALCRVGGDGSLFSGGTAPIRRTVPCWEEEAATARVQACSQGGGAGLVR